MTNKLCNRKLLSDFIRNNLEEEDRLDFLLHLDECPNCWEQVYSATKAQHPHFYKRPPKRKVSLDVEIELAEKKQKQSEEEDVFEVA
jgi:hypothetical protein